MIRVQLSAHFQGTLITCDTSGFHKGFSDGSEERFMVGFVGVRGTMYQKLSQPFLSNEI